MDSYVFLTIPFFTWLKDHFFLLFFSIYWLSVNLHSHCRAKMNNNHNLLLVPITIFCVFALITGTIQFPTFFYHIWSYLLIFFSSRRCMSFKVNYRKCGTEIQGSINPNDFNELVIIRISVILLFVQRPAKLDTFRTLTSSLIFCSHSKGLTVIIFGSWHVIITFYLWADGNIAQSVSPSTSLSAACGRYLSCLMLLDCGFICFMHVLEFLITVPLFVSLNESDSLSLV